MSRVKRIFLPLLIALVAFAQPGLCACWLMIDISAHHPHFEDPSRPHSHDYLSEVFQAQTVASAPPIVISAQALLAILALAALWRPLLRRLPSLAGWLAESDPPPPKLSFAV